MSSEQSSSENSVSLKDNVDGESSISGSKNLPGKIVDGSKKFKPLLKTRVNADNFESEEHSDVEFSVSGGATEAYSSTLFNGDDGYARESGEAESNAAGFTSSTFIASGSTGVDASTSSFRTQQQTFSTAYATNSQGVFQDPNPQVIKRPAVGGPQVFTQKVMVRFLQPPPLPEPGPLIIKEVRPAQPPPPPPLYIRQRPPAPPPLPPIVIRERPPKLPPPLGPQVITKVLPPIPVPPRSVIIERLPPLPPKPRDIIVERWLPYRATQKRRIIIQRAPPAPVQKPRNIIIYYEPPKARIVRRFENLGVQTVNPNEYVARYGSQLEDAQSLLSHARQAGVVEDINPPHNSVSSTFQSLNYGSYQTSDATAGAEAFSSGYEFSGGLSSSGNDQFVSYTDFNQSDNLGQEFPAKFVDLSSQAGFENSFQSTSGYETFSTAGTYGF